MYTKKKKKKKKKKTEITPQIFCFPSLFPSFYKASVSYSNCITP